jgi:hypothetical protein
MAHESQPATLEKLLGVVLYMRSTAEARIGIHMAAFMEIWVIHNILGHGLQLGYGSPPS